MSNSTQTLGSGGGFGVLGVVGVFCFCAFLAETTGGGVMAGANLGGVIVGRGGGGVGSGPLASLVGLVQTGVVAGVVVGVADLVAGVAAGVIDLVEGVGTVAGGLEAGGVAGMAKSAVFVGLAEVVGVEEAGDVDVMSVVAAVAGVVGLGGFVLGLVVGGIGEGSSSGAGVGVGVGVGASLIGVASVDESLRFLDACLEVEEKGVVGDVTAAMGV